MYGMDDYAIHSDVKMLVKCRARIKKSKSAKVTPVINDNWFSSFINKIFSTVNQPSPSPTSHHYDYSEYFQL